MIEKLLSNETNRMALFIAIYLLLITLFILKSQEDMVKIIDNVSCNSGYEIIEIPKTTIQYLETKAPPSDEELLDYYLTLKTDENTEEWFKGYKAIAASLENPPPTIYDIYTQDEIDLLCSMVQTETNGADFNSRVHVADVVWNRIKDTNFPNTITSIIMAPSQFGHSKKSYDERTKLAVEYSFMMDDTVQGAVSFHSGQKTNKFWGRDYIFTDTAGHHFY